MKSDYRKEQIIEAAAGVEFHPVNDIEKGKLHEYKKISLTGPAGLGTILAEINPAFRTIVSTNEVHVEGLWNLTFPKGIYGTLAQCKDGSGYLATILNHGIVGQARLNPVDFLTIRQSVTLPISPVSLFTAIALTGMNGKLDRIEEQNEMLLRYWKVRERNHQINILKQLTEINTDLAQRLYDEEWQADQCRELRRFRWEIEELIDNLCSDINETMKRRDPIHTDQQSKKMIDAVYDYFYYYKLALQMYSFARYLETVLRGDFSENILDGVRQDIRKKDSAYQDLYYRKCRALQHSVYSTLENKAGKAVPGKFRRSGNAILHKGSRYTPAESSLHRFKNDMRDSGSGYFADAVKAINHMYNDPTDILIDKDYLYLK